MSGFLRDLARRAQGQAAMMQRRRPSLFESRAPANAALAETIETEADVAPARAPATPAATIATRVAMPTVAEHNTATPTAAAASPSTPDLVPPARVATPGAVANAAPPRVETIETVRETILTVPAAVATQDLSIPPRARPERAQTATPAPAPASRHRVDDTPPAPTRARASRAETSEELKPPARAITTHEPQTVARRTVAPKPAQPAQLPTPQRATPRQNAVAQVAHPARRAAPAQAAVAAAPAPVQVSIGRIEIRAGSNPSAPAAAPRRAGAPTLGLDDYLLQRHGDRR